MSQTELEIIQDVLQKSHRIAVVGLSPNPYRPSNGVSGYMIDQGYEIVPVNPTVDEVLGLKSYPDISSIPGTVDMVDVFRNPEELEPILEEVLTLKIPRLWLQEGVINYSVFNRAREAGIQVVMNRCLMKEHARLGRSF